MDTVVSITEIIGYSLEIATPFATVRNDEHERVGFKVGVFLRLPHLQFAMTDRECGGEVSAGTFRGKWARNDGTFFIKNAPPESV